MIKILQSQNSDFPARLAVRLGIRWYLVPNLAFVRALSDDRENKQLHKWVARHWHNYCHLTDAVDDRGDLRCQSKPTCRATCCGQIRVTSLSPHTRRPGRPMGVLIRTRAPFDTDQSTLTRLNIASILSLSSCTIDVLYFQLPSMYLVILKFMGLDHTYKVNDYFFWWIKREASLL